MDDLGEIVRGKVHLPPLEDAQMLDRGWPGTHAEHGARIRHVYGLEIEVGIGRGGIHRHARLSDRSTARLWSPPRRNAAQETGARSPGRHPRAMGRETNSAGTVRSP